MDQLIQAHSALLAIKMKIALSVVDAALKGEKKFTLMQVVGYFDCSKG